MFRFSPAMAPVKVTVFPLLQREDLNRPAQQIAAALKAEGLSVVVDTTGAVDMHDILRLVIYARKGPAGYSCSCINPDHPAQGTPLAGGTPAQTRSACRSP